MRVTLTFDNGPDPEVTPRVLDVLAAHDARAHFYVLGKWLGEPARRRCVVRARDAGHLIGNHSFSHATPLGDDPRPDAVAREIIATADALADLLGEAPKRFRPFGGGGALGRHLLSPAAAEYLCVHGYSCVLWNSVPRDWIDPQAWPALALADCGELGHAVVVLHDLPNASLAGLDGFLAMLRAGGAEITTALPPCCTPIVDGYAVTDLGPLGA